MVNRIASPISQGDKEEENFLPVMRRHLSTVILILANILTIVFAVVQKWDIGDVVWIYWTQSIIIGFFHFFYILSQKQFSTELIKYDKIPIPATRATQHKMAWFFLCHYGLIHLIFFVFLRYLWQLTPSISALSFALCIIAFLGTHGFSYWESRQKVAATKPNIWSLMFHPYARVVPMWLTLTIGIQYARDYSTTLFLFLGLKTLADVIMHVTEIENVRADNRADKPILISNADETIDDTQPVSKEQKKKRKRKKSSEARHADLLAKKKWWQAKPTQD